MMITSAVKDCSIDRYLGASQSSSDGIIYNEYDDQNVPYSWKVSSDSQLGPLIAYRSRVPAKPKGGVVGSSLVGLSDHDRDQLMLEISRNCSIQDMALGGRL